ncbi:hypothetical protein [Effusibacillus dendaii]|nr:hypothetical protein [Effusibacillus dendaii]
MDGTDRGVVGTDENVIAEASEGEAGNGSVERENVLELGGRSVGMPKI